MNRIAYNISVVAALLLLPLSAQAVEISVTATSSGASNTLLLPGDTITFDIAVANASLDDVYALGLVASGHDLNQNGVADEGLSFNGYTEQNTVVPAGTSLPHTGNVSEYLWAVSDGSGGIVPNTGLTNIRGTNTTPGYTVVPSSVTGLPFDLWDYTGTGLGAFEYGFNTPVNVLLGLPTIQERYVAFMDGVTLGGTNGQAPFDETDEIAPGVQFQISFTAVGGGGTTFVHNMDFGAAGEFGALAVGQGGSTLPVQNASWSFTVIPEPGTALLLGLGLAGLAGQRRRA